MPVQVDVVPLSAVTQVGAVGVVAEVGTTMQSTGTLVKVCSKQEPIFSVRYSTTSGVRITQQHTHTDTLYTHTYCTYIHSHMHTEYAEILYTKHMTTYVHTYVNAFIRTYIHIHSTCTYAYIMHIH